MPKPSQNGLRPNELKHPEMPAKIRGTVAACCQQVAIAAAFAYCGWFAFGEGGALILAAMALLALAWRPADPSAPPTRRIQVIRDE